MLHFFYIKNVSSLLQIYRMNTARQSKYVIVNFEILVTYMNDTNICIRLLNSLLSNFLA